MGRPKKVVAAPEDKVSVLEAKMAGFEQSLGHLVDLLEKLEKKDDVLAPVEPKQEKAVVAAGPNKWTTNPDWEEAAKEILGDFLDHTEVMHEKTGGIMFTVVIKKEKSNASEQYLETTGSDRRTKEVGAAGLDGVTEWCKLIRQNLVRPT